MVKLRSQDGDSKEKEIDTEDPEEQRIARLEEIVAETKEQFAEILAKLNRFQGIQESDDRSALDRDTSPSMKAWRSGSDHFERSGDDRWFSEEDRRFRDYLMLRNDDDDETWTWTEHYSVMDDETDSLEEESMPQFQVPVSDSEILKSIEPGKIDLGLENEEYVVLNENLEQEWVQKKVKTSFEADGDIGKGQKVISNTKICCAHKVFGKRSHHQERLGIKKKRKGVKSWMFKYKRGDKKLHTLTFSNDMRMVVSPQLRMAETSGDLLMFNGKYSLPRRAITCKNVLEKIYDEKLEIVACQLRPAMMESLVPNKVIRKDGSKRHGRSEVSCDVDDFGDQESSSFKESVVTSTDLSTVTKIIDSGFVHVLHRDAVLDNMLGCTILSGGVIILKRIHHLIFHG